MPIKCRAPQSRTSPGQMVMPGFRGLEPNKKTPPAHHELAEQKQLFWWLERWMKNYPDLEWAHSSLNGLPMTPKVVRDASASGMRSGIWDIFLPCKRGGASGLYVEMKWDKNDLSENQKRFLVHLRKEGYKTAKAYSAVAAARAILDYLGIADESIERELRINTKTSTRAEPIYCDVDVHASMNDVPKPARRTASQ